MEILGQILIGLLAFLGAFLGTKTIKKQLVDGYIEARVLKAQEINDAVLSLSRSIISSFEQTYAENTIVSEQEIQEIVSKCKELSLNSEDGGKEVSTISYLLYETVKDLKPNYKNNQGSELLLTGDITRLVSSSLRLIIFYCTNSAPIPFKTKLIKKSSIKSKLRKYLSDKYFYGLKTNPFGLMLNPNSEVVLNFSSLISRFNSDIYSRNFYLFLGSNIPIGYQLLIQKIYMPLVLESERDEFLFGKHELHLVKIQSIKSVGEESGDFYNFTYSNINPMLKFVESIKLETLHEEYAFDAFLKRPVKLKLAGSLSKGIHESITIKVKADIANRFYKKNRWALRVALYKCRFSH